MKKLITTEKTEFEQNLKDLALIETDDRAGEPTMISSADLNEGFNNADSDVKELLSFDVNGENITITPTTSQQVITPSQGKNAILKATVKAVTSSIDNNITAGNIKDGVTILGVAGSYVKPDEPNLIAGNIKNGVSIYGVEGSYVKPEEPNLVAGNIKSGVSIYGVTGSYAGVDNSGYYFYSIDTTPMTALDTILTGDIDYFYSLIACFDKWGDNQYPVFITNGFTPGDDDYVGEKGIAYGANDAGQKLGSYMTISCSSFTKVIKIEESSDVLRLVAYDPE